jgi:hypothetical protein
MEGGGLTAELIPGVRENVLPREAGSQRDPDLANGEADVCAQSLIAASEWFGLGRARVRYLQAEPPQTVQEQVGRG